MGEVYKLKPAIDVRSISVRAEFDSLIDTIAESIHKAASAGSYSTKLELDMNTPNLIEVVDILSSFGYTVSTQCDNHHLLIALYISWYEVHNAPQRVAGSS